MAKHITDAYIKSLKTKSKRYDIPVDSGLRLRVAPTGLKTWLYRYTINKLTRTISLGNYPQIGLSDARTLQIEARQKHKEGIDLLEEKKEKEKEKEREKITTIESLANDFYTKYIETRRKQPLQVKQILDADVIKPLGKYKLETITTRQLVLSLEDIVDRGSNVHANKTLSIMKQMFGYGISKGIITDNPLKEIKAKVIGGDEKVRERDLSIKEIKAIWFFLDSSFHRINQRTVLSIKILLLTGVRSSELRLATWNEIDFKNSLWTIPKEHTKTGIIHKVHLTDFVTNLFIELKEKADQIGSNHIIPSTSDNLDSKGKIIDDKPLTEKATARAVARIQDRIKIEKWTPHDLRRSFATQQGEVIKTDPVVIEKLLGHKLPKIMATYNKNEMLDERKVALEKWSGEIENLLKSDAKGVKLLFDSDGSSSQVVP